MVIEGSRRIDFLPPPHELNPPPPITLEFRQWGPLSIIVINMFKIGDSDRVETRVQHRGNSILNYIKELSYETNF